MRTVVRRAFILVGCLAGLALVQDPLHATPSPPDSRGHRHLIELSPAATPGSRRVLPSRSGTRQEAATQPLKGDWPAVDRDVIAYLPYWEMDYVVRHWELLTVLAWFAAEMDSTGAITAWHGWGGDATESLVAEAHAHGVKVVVTVTNFSDSSIASLVNSPQNRAKAIESFLELMAVHGADGVNIDFEMVPASGREGFVTFMADLKSAVVAAQPNGTDGHVTLAGPSVDWWGSYDYEALLEHTDGIMVMAYGYHWGGGPPGVPVGGNL